MSGAGGGMSWNVELGMAGGTVFTAGTGGTGGGGVGGGSGGTAAVALHLVYTGPVMPGSIVMNAWWQPPQVVPRSWAPVLECADVVPGDGKLDCVFHVPHGTKSLEWQLDLPDGRYWGDESCWTTGGCGKPIGTLALFGENGAPIAYTMIPNNPGEPYLKGHVDLIP